MAKLWHFEANVEKKHALDLWEHLTKLKAEITAFNPVVERGKNGKAGGETINDLVLRMLEAGPQPSTALNTAVKAAGFSGANNTIWSLGKAGVVTKNSKGIVSLKKKRSK